MASATQSLSCLWSDLKRIVPCPRPDGESLRRQDRIIGRNRLLFGLASAFYCYYLSAIDRLDSEWVIAVNAAYLAVAVAAYSATKNQRWKSDVLRSFMLLIDVSALSFAFAAAGSVAAPMLFLNIWLVLGYGFRYGVYYLRLAAITSVCGLSAALFYTDYWQTQPFISIGILMLAIVIPLYLELLLRKVTQANEAARSANQSKALMLAELGKTLQTPIAAIFKATQAILDASLHLRQREALIAIQAAAGSLMGELDNFLDAARIDAGRMPKEVTSFSVKGLVEEALANPGVQAASKGLAVSWHIAPDVPERIWSERRSLLKSLTNVLDNAVRFTSVGSILVTVYAKCDTGEEFRLRFEVLDTGLGVDAEARGRIFEGFMQASPEILHVFGGAGLGLFTARRMVKMLGGEIGVISEVGRGSTFWFEVPLTKSKAGNSVTGNLAGNSVIVLTSNIASLSSFAAKLERLGAKTILSDQREWLNAVTTTNLDQTGCIIMIVDGRNTDLAELGSALQRDQLLDHTPLVALTKTLDLPHPSIQRRFVTSVSSEMSEQHLISALRLAGAQTQEPIMKTGDPSQQKSSLRSNSIASRNRILIADTNRGNVLILSKILEVGGHTYLVVSTGDGALVAVERELFDIMFIDMDKRSVDGLEAVKLLRFQELGKHRTTVFGVTSHENLAVAERCKESGCDDIVLQPFDAPSILGLIAKTLSIQSSDNAPSYLEDDSIRPIAAHPRFRAGLGPAIADDTFPYLLSIGGVSFIGEVTKLFIADAGLTLAKLSNALEYNDYDGFRTCVVSLGESAVMIGASRLADLCKTAAVLSKERLSLGERALAASLRSEVARVVARIEDHESHDTAVSGVKSDDSKPGDL